VVGEVVEGLASNQALLNLITSASRHLTGWPIFAALHNADDRTRRPAAVDDGWETAVFSPQNDPWGFNTVDFWRIQPDGKMYAIRAYAEDLNPQGDGGRVLGIAPAIRNVADGLAESLAIARRLVQNPDEASLVITLRWTDLAGRSLSNVFSRRFWSFTGSPAIDSDATSVVTLPVDLPDSALAARVEVAVAPLFRKFGGFEVGASVIDGEVKDVLKSQ
jgi:hypothetical protein